MNLEELYKLCFENRQSELNPDEPITVSMTGQSSIYEGSDEKVPYGLKPFFCYAYHDHINLNHSRISPDVFKEKISDMNFRPILAHIVYDEETGEPNFGGHDVAIKNEGTSTEHIEYLEKPVGVICGQNHIVEDSLEGVSRAKIYGYLFEEYCPDVVSIIENAKDKTVDVSVELMIKDFEFDPVNEVLDIKDYDLSGVTLLGKGHVPGMKGSKLSIKDFEDEFERTDNQALIDVFERFTKELERFNNQKGGTEVAEENKQPEEEVVETPIPEEPEVEEQTAPELPEEEKEPEVEVIPEEEPEVEGPTEAEKEIASLKEQIAELEAQAKKYQKIESDRLKEEILNDRSYEQFVENEHFKKIVANKDNYSVEEFKTECELAFAKSVKEVKQFTLAAEEKAPKGRAINLADPAEHKVNKRYGNLI